MGSKELLALRLLIDNPRGVFASELGHLAKGSLVRGTLYSLLERMANDGHATKEVLPPEVKLQMVRTRYKITPLGRDVYDGFLREQGLAMVPFKEPR